MERLNEWPMLPGRGRSYKYDYDRLFDGSIYKCKRGVDFTCKRMSFAQHLRTRAVERGLEFHYVNMPDDPDSIVIQASTPNNPS